MSHYVQPVILSGGFGTRLWPASRDSMPKQLIKIIGDRSSFRIEYGIYSRVETRVGSSCTAPSSFARSDWTEKGRYSPQLSGSITRATQDVVVPFFDASSTNCSYLALGLIVGGNSIGSVTDSKLIGTQDTDGDGVPDPIDNCPTVRNGTRSVPFGVRPRSGV